MFKSISRQTKYITDRDKVPNNFFDDIYDDLNLEAIKNSVESRFALTVKYTNQKLVPIDLSLLKRRGEIYFDRNQNLHWILELLF